MLQSISVCLFCFLKLELFTNHFYSLHQQSTSMDTGMAMENEKNMRWQREKQNFQKQKNHRQKLNLSMLSMLLR